MIGNKLKCVMLLLFSMLMQSCYYVEFFEPYETRDIPVSFEWENTDSIPNSMRVIVYPADAETSQRIRQGYSIFDMYNTGCNIALPIGKYEIISFNTDTENIYMSDYNDRENIIASLTDYPIHAAKNFKALLDSLYGGLPIKEYPSYMVSGKRENFVVNPKDNKPLVIKNSPIIKKVNVSISSIKGLESVQQVMLSIAPFASRSNIVYTNHTDQNCILVCEASFAAKERTVYSDFNIFNVSESNDCTIILMFLFSTGNIYLPIEIGDMEQYYMPEKDCYEIEIINLDIDLKDYILKQEGFDIDVDDWSDVNIDINI